MNKKVKILKAFSMITNLMIRILEIFKENKKNKYKG